MSLVNEALKRAKEAQQTAPTPRISAPQFLTAEETKKASGWLSSPFTMVGAGIVVLLALWQFLSQNHGPVRTPVESTVASTGDGANPTVSAPEPPANQPTMHSAAPAAAPRVEEPHPTAAAPTGEIPPANPPAAQPMPQVQPVAAVVAAPPAPPPLKLQAVIWNPKRPSAIINGQTVFMGDTVRGLRVSRITADSATLSGNSQSEFLKLTN